VTDDEKVHFPGEAMNAARAQERKLIDYLLGTLPEGDRAALEDRLFVDEALDEELLATTDDLIQEYLEGRLSEDERRRFETHFLTSPDHRDRLAWMKDLQGAIERTPAPAVLSPSWRRHATLMLAAAAVLLVALALTLRVPHGGGTQEAAHTPTPEVTAAPTANPTPPARQDSTPTPSKPNRVHTVRLARAASPTPVDVALPSEASTLRIEVAVSDESPSYDAMIRSADGREVWRAEGLVPESAGAPLILSVPSRILIADAYALRVEGEALREGSQVTLEYSLRVIHTH
jgi:hypothetical protein